MKILKIEDKKIIILDIVNFIKDKSYQRKRIFKMFTLYKNGKILLTASYWEDLVSFVEIMKQYNKNFINRKDFVVKCNNEKIYSWKRK